MNDKGSQFTVINNIMHDNIVNNSFAHNGMFTLTET